MNKEKSILKYSRMIDEYGNRIPFAENKINKKANRRLKQVTDQIIYLLSDYFTRDNDSMLTEVLTCYDLEQMEKIFLLYQCENRFAAMSYNFWLQSFYETTENENYIFALKTDGMASGKKLRFVDVKMSLIEDERKNKILQLLNDNLILKKCKDLDILEVYVYYLMDEGRWTISVKSMIGSTTWIMIPPVMHTITPRNREIFGMVELLRMLHRSVTV